MQKKAKNGQILRKIELLLIWVDLAQINWADYFEPVHQKYTVFISCHLLFISCKYVL